MITVKLNARVVTVMAEESIQFRTGPMRKKTIVFEEAEAEYTPAQIAVDWWGDKADLVKAINAGDVVVVEFKIESRPGKYGKPYTTCNGREIALAKLETEDAPQSAEQTPSNAPTFSDGEVAPF